MHRQPLYQPPVTAEFDLATRLLNACGRWDAAVARGPALAILRGLRWRGGRVAEGARLESVWAGNRLVGSNPTPSASPADCPPWPDILRYSSVSDAGGAQAELAAATQPRNEKAA